jgi:hypothetical protein
MMKLELPDQQAAALESLMDVMSEIFCGGKHSLKALPAGARGRFS